MIRSPINNGLLQSDLDCAGFDLLNFSRGGGGTAHGIPAGGSAGQSLTKIDGTDYNAHWSTVTGGGGSSGPNALITANVKDAPYSAAGDGVTDDSAAINAAIAAVVTAGGGTVFFPKGIYLCNGAFDASFNCILKIPNPATPVTVELIGEEHPPWGVFTTFDLTHASTIRTTKTGTGTGPALLAGSQARGTGRVPDYTTMSNALVKIRNLNFILPDNPSLHGVRLDGVGQAFVENSNVMVEAQNAATAFTQPTHGTTGLWMPNTINFSMNWIKHVTVTGFDTGFMTGEHLRAPMMQAFNCINGVSFLEAMYPSWAKIQLGNCVEGIRFIGQHTVDLLVETEHAPSGWQACAHDIKDASNYGSGSIQCYVGSGFPPASTYPAIDGGSGLQIIDMFSRTISIPATGTFQGKVYAPSILIGYTDTGLIRSNNSEITATNGSTGLSDFKAGTVYVGTDARFTPVSGGVKLEVRNTSTGTWVEATRYTNP